MKKKNMMNIFKIAIILSSAATAMAADALDASAAPLSVLDSRIEIKVTKWDIPDALNLKDRLNHVHNPDNSSAEFSDEFNSFKEDFRAAKNAATEILNQEKKVLNNLSQNLSDVLKSSGYNSIVLDALELIDGEKTEWARREESFFDLSKTT